MPSDICSGAELARVPSNLGNEPEDFNRVSMENKAKGIFGPQHGGVTRMSLIKSLSEGFFTGPQSQLETSPPELLLKASCLPFMLLIH